jgi:hypothetical protein
LNFVLLVAVWLFKRWQDEENSAFVAGDQPPQPRTVNQSNAGPVDKNPFPITPAHPITTLSWTRVSGQNPSICVTHEISHINKIARILSADVGFANSFFLGGFLFSFVSIGGSELSLIAVLSLAR